VNTTKNSETNIQLKQETKLALIKLNVEIILLYKYFGM